MKKQMKIAVLAQGSKGVAGTYKLTEKLARSYEFRLLAVHKVIVNNGGKTPGVDKETIASEAEVERMVTLMLNYLNRPNDYKVSPVKRIYIPKGSGGLRPPFFFINNNKKKIGIPTIKDRCMQSLVKLILEPITEINSDPNSFGFRKGRSAKNALAELRYSLRTGNENKYVLDADIKKYFDNISHD